MQIVGYESAPAGDDDRAALWIVRESEPERERLGAGTELAYTLGDRHCAGTFDRSGERATHRSCESESAPYCDVHTDRWPCARCTGECSLPLESCREEHAIYLAAFAPATFKVGVTRSWRLETRLREQGADRGAHLRTVDDGRIARQIEGEIATEVGDRVPVSAKIRGLHRAVDEASWQELLADYEPHDTWRFDYGLDLTERPVEETIATGTVQGVQGRVLVLARGGSTYAVDMRELVGYEVSDGSTDRALQSSFAAFE